MNIAVKLASKQILFLKRYVLSKSNIASEFKDDNLSIIEPRSWSVLEDISTALLKLHFVSFD